MRHDLPAGAHREGDRRAAGLPAARVAVTPDAMGRGAPSLDVSRHAVALACVAVGRHGPLAALLPRSLLAGGVYALSLAVSLRRRPRVSAVVVPVVVAALLNAGNVRLGQALYGSGQPFGAWAATVVPSAFGAITFGVLLRATWLPALRCRSIMVLALGCALAVAVAIRWPLPVAVDALWQASFAWWVTFSAILCYLDCRAGADRC